MSAPLRDHLTILNNDSILLLDNQKTFPLPPEDLSPSKIHSEIRKIIPSLELELQNVTEAITDISSNHDKWMAVRSSMTGAERIADNPLYDAFSEAVPYLTTLYKLKKYQKTLRSSRQILIAALPDPTPPNQSHMHLPKLSLPKFSGNCIEYVSFWNSFCAGVHDLSTISNSVKFSYLKECLSGPALLLVKSLPLTDASYNEAIRLLKENYGQPEEINRNLHISLKKLPTVHSNRGPEILCKELSTFVDESEIIYLQMLEQNFDANTLSIQMDIEEKLPPTILEEILEAKEAGNWSTDKLRTLLKTTLKRKQGVCTIIEQNKETPFQFKKVTTRSPSPPQSIYEEHSSSLEQPEQPNTSITFATQTKENYKFNKFPIVPKFPCLFCEEGGHFSSKCPKFPDLKSRLAFIRAAERCFRCLKPDHFANDCPHPSKCSKCYEFHPRPLCPNTHKKRNNTNKPQSQLLPLFSQNYTYPGQINQPFPMFNPYFYYNPMYAFPPFPPQNLNNNPQTRQNDSPSPNSSHSQNRITNFCVQSTKYPEISHSPLNHNQNLISQGTTLNTMDKKAQQSMNRPNNSTIEETSQQTPPHSLLPTKQPTSNKSPIPYKKPEAPKQTPCPNQPQKMKSKKNKKKKNKFDNKPRIYSRPIPLNQIRIDPTLLFAPKFGHSFNFPLPLNSIPQHKFPFCRDCRISRISHLPMHSYFSINQHPIGQKHFSQAFCPNLYSYLHKSPYYI